MKTYAPGFGLEVVEVPHARRRRPTRRRCGRRREDAACVIFQQPNFFGLPRARAGAGRRRERRRRAGDRPRRPGLARRARGARATTAARLAIGEGQGAGNYQSYAGPHYGFLASKAEYTRRLPGRIIGETTDLNGERGYVLTLQTREQHIRREKATSNITTNQTLLALAGLVHLSWLGPQGLREVGETCMSLGAYAKERLGLPLAVPGPADLQGVRRPRRPPGARRDRAPRASTASIPATRSAATTRAWTTCSCRRHREAHARPTSTGSPHVLAEVRA